MYLWSKDYFFLFFFKMGYFSGKKLIISIYLIYFLGCYDNLLINIVKCCGNIKWNKNVKYCVIIFFWIVFLMFNNVIWFN